MEELISFFLRFRRLVVLHIIFMMKIMMKCCKPYNEAEIDAFVLNIIEMLG